MPDHIPADKLRELADDMANWQLPANIGPQDIPARFQELANIMDGFIGRLNELIEPPLPTLADMTPEEREKCQRLQCEVDGVLTGVIVHIGGENAVILWRSGMRSKARLSRVTPRPDLPPLRWPGGEPDVSKSATGQVVAKDICNKEPQPGEAWLIDVAGDKRESVKLDNTNMCWLTVDDTGTTVCYMESEIDLITRLVPETPRKTLATVEDYRNAPARWICLDETADDEGVFYKLEDSLWMDGMGYVHSPADMADTPRTVIWEPED